jgi:DNA-directed RNA polymerase sigma subunit (sigma70/sigma32)
MANGPVVAIDAIDQTVSELIEQGKRRKYLTWEELNESLPDEAISPEKLESVLNRIEQNGIRMIDEIEAEKLRESNRTRTESLEGGESLDEVTEADLADATVRRIDDPVRMYLTQMGEIPLLTREEEIALAKKIELTRMAYRRRVLENDFCMKQAVDTIQAVADGRMPFDRTMKISTTESMAKAAILRRLPANLGTVRRLSELNARCLAAATSAWWSSRSPRSTATAGSRFLDIIQEGNTGLMRAVDKYEYKRGYKFSTYATWWIRQAITRAIADHARTIRIPVHMIETMTKLRNIQKLLQKTGASRPSRSSPRRPPRCRSPRRGAS